MSSSRNEHRNQKLHRQFGFAIWIAALGMVQFVMLCPVAIWLYPREFSLSSDYLSFLGCVESPVEFHALVFNVSLICLGGALFWLFWSMCQVTKRGPGELFVCSVTGMFTACSLMLVGLLPVNLFYYSHIFAMVGWLFFTVLTLIFWLDWQQDNRQGKPISVARLGLIAITAYPLAVMLAWGPAMQKVIVALDIAWFGYFSFQLQHSLRLGEVRKWLEPRLLLTRPEKRTKVRYINPPATGR